MGTIDELNRILNGIVALVRACRVAGVGKR